MSIGEARLRPGDPRDILALKFEVEFEDVVNLKRFYKYLHQHLKIEQFNSADGDGDKWEPMYYDKTLISGAKEHRIWWRLVRNPGKSQYFREFLKIDWRTLWVTDMSVMYEGQKFKSNRADITMMVEFWLQLDPNNKWEKNWLLRRIDDWFRRRLYFNEIEKKRLDLHREGYRLNSMMKQYFHMKTPTTWGKPFHPERGVGNI